MGEKQPAPPRMKLGNLVKIRRSNSHGMIVELRGPLGPGGAHIYRIRIDEEPEPAFVEVREDQLVLLPAKRDTAAPSS